MLDANPESARRTARAFLAHYLTLVNYTINMQRAGVHRQARGKVVLSKQRM